MKTHGSEKSIMGFLLWAKINLMQIKLVYSLKWNFVDFLWGQVDEGSMMNEEMMKMSLNRIR
ncbi:Uncharacterised protein [Providencia stuartii]|nr:Uncharacterised protein [Providencia stuartii]